MVCNSIFIIILLIILIIITNNNFEKFDGVGKSFGQFYFPQNCCKSRDCYPGSYLGADFWAKNWPINGRSVCNKKRR